MELYSKPATEFVATFIGSPKMNLVKGPAAAAENAATLGIRPEDLTVGDSGAWSGRVRVVEHLGNETIAYVQSNIGDLVVRQPARRSI
jgi:multiple sugar transport system ATP-binding protein